MNPPPGRQRVGRNVAVPLERLGAHIQVPHTLGHPRDRFAHRLWSFDEQRIRPRTRRTPRQRCDLLDALGSRVIEREHEVVRADGASCH